MKIMLLGASGVFGTAFEALCIQKQVDILPLSSREIDITDSKALDRVFSSFSPTVVVNAVAIVGINPCEYDPVRAFAVNTTSVAIISKLCAERDAILVQPSTHAVFDGKKQTPYTEDDITNPGSIYSISKYGAECLARHNTHRHYVVRFPTLFGKRRNTNVGFCDKVIQWIIEGREMRIATDKMDSPTYTKDAAERVFALIAESKPYGVYHVTNEGSVSYFDLAVKIADIMQISAKNIFPALDADFPTPAYKPLRTALTTNRLPPLRSWENALHDYLTAEVL